MTTYLSISQEAEIFTQTHILIGAAIFARPEQKAISIAAIAGSVVPDLDVWVMFAVERLRGLSSCEIFHFRYWEQPWTILQASMSSLPLWTAVLVLALIATFATTGTWRRRSVCAAVFTAAVVLHLTIDFLLHHDDARAQFQPFTDWVFRSPVSYWDPAHFGWIVMPIEIALGIVLAGMIVLQFRTRSARVGTAMLCTFYAVSLAALTVGTSEHDRSPGSCSKNSEIADAFEEDVNRLSGDQPFTRFLTLRPASIRAAVPTGGAEIQVSSAKQY